MRILPQIPWEKSFRGRTGAFHAECKDTSRKTREGTQPMNIQPQQTGEGTAPRNTTAPNYGMFAMLGWSTVEASESCSAVITEHPPAPAAPQGHTPGPWTS